MNTGIELYYTHRPKMRTGDLLLWKSDTLLGKLIRLFTDSNHASLILRFRKQFEGVRKRRFLLEALEHGITLALISDRLKNFKGEAYWYPVKDAYNPLRDGVASWALNEVGTPYDFRSLFRNALGRVSTDANNLFCSEYFFLAWQSQIPDLLSPWGEGKAPRPGDLPKLGLFRKPVRVF